MKALTIALLFAASTASAASFDCQVKNLNAIEKAICAVPEISLLDDQMAEAFKAVSHIPEVKVDQRAYIKTRNASTSLSELKDNMTDRIIELQIIAELEGVQKKPHSEIVRTDSAKATSKATSRRPVEKDTVADLIWQAKQGDELNFRGKTSYTDYRDKNAPIWMRDCAYRIVRNDVMGRWVAQARSAGLINEFKSVEYKIETGFINMTIDNLKMNIQKSRQVCEAMAIGTTW